mgnify:CR=1 FL=1|tara:strand:- start:63 stop:275 length:213 start_codon:yes stop_codon:yes gene_type:complete
MALDKQALKTEIVSLLTDMLVRENTSIDEFATRLSNAVDEFVKSADIVYASGLIDGESMPVTGVFNGQLQ